MSVELTDAQERALIGLANHRRMHGPDAFTRPPGVSAPTLYALKRHGYARTSELPTTTVASITDAGLALCDSMGD